MQTVVCIDGGVSPRTVCHLMEWHLVEWHLVEFPAQRHPEQLPRSSEELDLPGSSRLGALQLGLTPPPLCSGHAQRTRFGPGSGSGKTDVVKRRFLPAKSFIRVGVTSRGHRFQPRIPPPGSLCSNPYNLDSGSPANLPAALSLSASTLWLSAAGAGTTAWRHVWVATAVLRDITRLPPHKACGLVGIDEDT